MNRSISDQLPSFLRGQRSQSRTTSSSILLVASGAAVANSIRLVINRLRSRSDSTRQASQVINHSLTRIERWITSSDLPRQAKQELSGRLDQYQNELLTNIEAMSNRSYTGDYRVRQPMSDGDRTMAGSDSPSSLASGRAQ